MCHSGDVTVFPLISSVIAVCLVEQGHVEVDLKGHVTLGFAVLPGGG